MISLFDFMLGFIFGCITGLISKNAIIIKIKKEKKEKKEKNES